MTTDALIREFDAASGRITFAPVAPAAINGQQGHWMESATEVVSAVHAVVVVVLLVVLVMTRRSVRALESTACVAPPADGRRSRVTRGTP